MRSSSIIRGAVFSVLSLSSPVLAEFTWENVPDEMVVGQTYDISWSGALGPVTIYLKGSELAASWRSYVYGGGKYITPQQEGSI